MPGMRVRHVRGPIWYLLIIVTASVVLYRYVALVFWPPFTDFYTNVWPYNSASSAVRVRLTQPQALNDVMCKHVVCSRFPCCCCC